MIGQVIAHYRILEKLGEGGMGEVYLAEDTKLRRKVALKILPQQFIADPIRKRRFLQEAIAASALSHPNVAVVYEANEAYISMEYVPGETLKHALEVRKLSMQESLRIASQIAEALYEARHRGIVHRDIKPGNVMLMPDRRIKVLDFGLAKIRDEEVASSADGSTMARTDAGTILGTAAYMSPEQALGRPVDHRSDLFSVGVLLYEMIQGKNPFAGGASFETLTRICQWQPERLKNAPPELERIIFKALEKDPDRRYQTARDLLLDLQSAAGKLTARKPKRWPAIAAVVAVLAIAVLIGISIPRARRVNAPARVKSVAVLPFVNMSGSAENEFISDGMSEEIINALAHLPDLKVVARTSAFAFKGKNADIREIGEKLGVDSIVEGSVQKASNKLRVTAQLISVNDGYHIWSDTYDREATDIFAIQDDIASAIASALHAKLVPGRELVRPSTRDPKAYEDYLSGRHFSAIWTTATFNKALDYYRKALARDPSFALAYAGEAETYSLMDHTVDTPLMPPAESFRLAIEAAGKALRLDPNCAEAHAALGHILVHQGHFADAEAHLKQALRLNPGSASAHLWYSVLLAAIGRPHDATAHAEKARELDPLSVQVTVFAAIDADLNGNFKRALELDERALELAPDDNMIYVHLAYEYAMNGNSSDAERTLERASRLPEPPAALEEVRAFVFAMSNRRRDSLALLKKIEREKQPSSARFMSWSYAALGDRDRSIEWLQRFAKETPNFARLNMDFPRSARFDPMRADPRYRALRKQLGLPD